MIVLFANVSERDDVAVVRGDNNKCAHHLVKKKEKNGKKKKRIRRCDPARYV